MHPLPRWGLLYNNRATEKGLRACGATKMARAVEQLRLLADELERGEARPPEPRGRHPLAQGVNPGNGVLLSGVKFERFQRLPTLQPTRINRSSGVCRFANRRITH